MARIIFNNLEKSELAKEVVRDHLKNLTDRFPDLKSCRLVITLDMHNSPTQAGPDEFSVKFHCRSGKYKGAILEKRESTLYKALAELSNHLPERLNRHVEKNRSNKIKNARHQKRMAQEKQKALENFAS
ncbi:MAG: HPF/RaiA family ribosome-associated protein [Bdellovibrionales bacterium]